MDSPHVCILLFFKYLILFHLKSFTHLLWISNRIFNNPIYQLDYLFFWHYRMVLHKLVNSTNVVLHMLDLQPYAMILPMNKTTSQKNKIKILSKVFKNNLDIYSTYKSELRHYHLNRLKSSDKNLNKNIKSEDLNNNNNNEFKSDQHEINEHIQTSQLQDNTYQNNQQIDLKKDNNEQKNLEESIHNKLNQNHHESIEEQSDDDMQEDIFTGVRRFIDRIDSDNIIGCMIILAQRGSDKTSISPVAGGIVEVFDDYERSIQTLWLNNNISKYVTFTNLKGKKNSRKLISSLNDHILAKVVLSTLTLRLCAHAYQMTLPNSKRIQHKSRLISIYHQMGQTFPHFAYSFIKEEMQFSKHYEITSIAIKHNDNPKIPCKCLKPTQFDNNEIMDYGTTTENSPLFFGITESRFSGMYTSTYEPILIGFMNLLSGKLSDISKIVRFEDPVTTYEEENEYKSKRQKITYRSKRLQNRV